MESLLLPSIQEVFFPPLFSSGREEKEREFFAQAEKWVEKRSGGKKEKKGEKGENFFIWRGGKLEVGIIRCDPVFPFS